MKNKELLQYSCNDINNSNWTGRSKLESIIFCVVLIELFVMGSGRLLEFGPLTFRMILFVGCMLIVCYKLITGQKGVSELSFYFVCSFTFLLSLATFLGYANLSDQSSIAEDIKPLLYFFLLLYFEMIITDMRRIRLVIRLIKLSAMVMAGIYLMILASTYAGIIDFKYLYELLSNSSDFMFRGETGESGIFYKGFLYLCIGLIFYLFESRKKTILFIIVLIAAIVLTFTKGFVAAVIPVILLGYYLKSKNVLSVTALSLVLVSLGTFFILNMAMFVGDKSESDLVRVVTAGQVIDAVTLKSVLVGHGFGQGVPEKPVHMETSLLEIFHKQGLIGLFFWFAFIYFIIYYYRQACNCHNDKIALPFMLSSVFVYLQSITNPYMNNPIGMSFLLISIVVLRLLSLPDGHVEP